MKEWLNRIRKPSKDIKLSTKIINSLFILLIGILLGIFSKWLDNMALDNTIFWQNILGILNLRNFFSEFGIWIFLAVAISVFSKTPLREFKCFSIFFRNDY